MVPTVPGYRDLVPIGRGGYSEVHRALQERFDRWVALKVLTFAVTDERAQRQFLRECQVTGRVTGHPNVVTVFDSGLTTDGRPYLAMELYDGGSLADRIRTSGPLPLTDALRYGVTVAGALETAHRAGVLHRDVTPANVLISAYGQPALADFGLSIVDQHHEVSSSYAFTPNHVAPEVLERRPATAASDVYALASTVYTLLAGRSPFQGDEGEGLATVLLRILSEDVPRLERDDAPAALDGVLRAALAREPTERTSTALELAEGLRDLQIDAGLEPTDPVVVELGSSPVLSPPPPAGHHPTPASGPPRPAPPPAAVFAPSFGQTVGGAAQALPGLPAAPGQGDLTAHRAGPAAPPGPPPPADEPRASRGTRMAVAGLGALAAVALVTVAVLLLRGGSGDDDPDPGPGPDPGEVERPTDLEASDGPAGVRLTWSGPPEDRYVVLVLSESAPPRTVTAEGTELLLVAAEVSDDGHCFAVAGLDAVAALDEPSEAFTAPVCIRGASQDTVRSQ